METKDLQRRMMNRAFELAREGREMDNGGPFGAVITRGDKIIAESRNEVVWKGDCTHHAELKAIQRACKNLNTNDLKGCVMYTSCEPCMMCLGAAHWVDLDYIYYGASAQDAKDFGFVFSDIYNDTNSHERHEEFKMIQIYREEALKIWEQMPAEKLHM